MIGVKKHMKSFCDAGDVSSCVFYGMDPSQQRAITIDQLDVVRASPTPGFHLKVCEVNVDNTALWNFNSSPLMKIIGIVEGEVRRCQHPTCRKGLWILQ